MRVAEPRGLRIYSNPAPKAVVSQQSLIPKAVTPNGWQYHELLILHGLFLGSSAFLFDSILGSSLLERAAGPGKHRYCTNEAKEL